MFKRDQMGRFTGQPRQPNSIEKEILDRLVDIEVELTDMEFEMQAQNRDKKTICWCVIGLCLLMAVYILKT